MQVSAPPCAARFQFAWPAWAPPQRRQSSSIFVHNAPVCLPRVRAPRALSRMVANGAGSASAPSGPLWPTVLASCARTATCCRSLESRCHVPLIDALGNCLRTDRVISGAAVGTPGRASARCQRPPWIERDGSAWCVRRAPAQHLVQQEGHGHTAVLALFAVEHKHDVAGTCGRHLMQDCAQLAEPLILDRSIRHMSHDHEVFSCVAAICPTFRICGRPRVEEVRVTFHIGPAQLHDVGKSRHQHVVADTQVLEAANCQCQPAVSADKMLHFNRTRETACNSTVVLTLLLLGTVHCYIHGVSEH